MFVNLVVNRGILLCCIVLYCAVLYFMVGIVKRGGVYIA